MKWLCFLMVRVTQMEGKPGHVWQQPWQSPGTGQVTSRVVVTAIIQAPKGGWRTCLLSSLSTPRVWGSLHCDFKVFSSCLNSLFFWIIYLQTYKEMVNTTKNYQKRCPCWVIDQKTTGTLNLTQQSANYATWISHLFIKFYWNIATSISSCIVYGYFWAMMAQLNSSDTVHRVCKPKIFTMWSCKKKFTNLWCNWLGSILYIKIKL